MLEETMNKKLFSMISHMAAVHTSGGSATTQVVKFLGSHVPVQMPGA